MKRVFYLTALLLVALVSIGLLTTRDDSQAQSNNLVAFLTVNSGSVEINRVETSIWVPVPGESVVGAGDSVRTSENGSATLRFFGGDSSIEMDGGTEITLSQLQSGTDGNVVSVDVASGTARYALEPLLDMDSSYQFNTPGMTVFTREGEFEMSVYEDSTTVYTTEGSVFVNAQGNVVEIPAGSGMTSDPVAGNSGIVPVDNIAQLDASVKGVPASLSIEAEDIQLNVRQGPSLEHTLLGTISPEEVTRVYGVDENANWYRIPYENGYGWVSIIGLALDIDIVDLVVYSSEHVEAQGVDEAVEIQMVADVPGAGPSEAAADTGTNTAATAEETSPAGPSIITPLDFTYEELEMLAALNEWRVSLNLAPFKPNSILTTMARDQARYLMSLPGTPDDWHRDAQGRYPRERATAAEYNWPYYGIAARVAVGEIAYTGATPESAINWWKGSDIHNRTVINPAYREVGIAALPHPYGQLYIVVFGARPNVFPAFIEQDSGQLYVTTERYEYASGGDWITNVEQIQLIPTPLSQLSEDGWQNWTRDLPLPEGFEEAFAVAFREGEKVVIVQIDTRLDVVWLPHMLTEDITEAPGEDELESLELEGSTGSSEPSLFPTNTPAP